MQGKALKKEKEITTKAETILERAKRMSKEARIAMAKFHQKLHRAVCARYLNTRYTLRQKLISEKGQGTTEYAILVGVLVVIAILAITIFKPKLEELWNAIASGINGL